MIKEIKAIDKEIHQIIETRIGEYKAIWERQDEKELFSELAFCLLTPQTKAKNADKAIKTLVSNGLLYGGSADEIKIHLKGIRFQNRKSEFIILAREFFNENKGLINYLKSFKNDFEKRNALIKDIKGIGYKEAGHYLRNIGFVENLTILDRHILKNLALSKVIDEVPKSLSKNKYLEIEEKMKKFAKKIKIPIEYLDLILWYKEAGEVFK